MWSHLSTLHGVKHMFVVNCRMEFNFLWQTFAPANLDRSSIFRMTRELQHSPLTMATKVTLESKGYTRGVESVAETVVAILDIHPTSRPCLWIHSDTCDLEPTNEEVFLIVWRWMGTGLAESCSDIKASWWSTVVSTCIWAECRYRLDNSNTQWRIVW